MIDLNLTNKKKDDEPVGLIILAVLPLLTVFWLAACAVL